MLKKIVITGGPGSGKTSLIDFLEENGYQCQHEISRQVTLEAKKKGIDQLFLSDPILFSQLLLKGRLQQYQEVDHFKKQYYFMIVDCQTLRHIWISRMYPIPKVFIQLVISIAMVPFLSYRHGKISTFKIMNDMKRMKKPKKFINF